VTVSNADLAHAIAALDQFIAKNLTKRLAAVEHALVGRSIDAVSAIALDHQATTETLAGASRIKSIASEINVIIHAVGIVACLPRVLDEGEVIRSVSLGAGNTGKDFDLETDQRVAEFKFIRWRGGSETIRQNVLFKDFYKLAEHPTMKRKYLYVLGTDEPLKFLNGRRQLRSVLKDAALNDAFFSKHGSEYHLVRDYFVVHCDRVNLVDVSPYVPELTDSDGGIA